MAQINLLPRDLAPRAAVIKTTGVVKKILTIGFLIFVIAAVGLSVFYIVLSKNLNQSKAKVSELKNNVSALEQTEQRLLLTKDRLEKASQVLAASSSSDEIDSAATLLASLPSDSGLASADFKEEESLITFKALNSEAMAGLIKSVTSSGLYKSVEIESFSFTPVQGYLINFNLLK